MKHVVEVCIGINAAILGIAYPILLSRGVNVIGDKYSSDYLSEVFKYEWVNGKVFNKYSRFQVSLVVSLLVFIFPMLSLHPLRGCEIWFLNNSADLIVLVVTASHVSLFLHWIHKIFQYNQKPKDIIKFLLDEFKECHDDEQKSYYLKTINEFASYSILKEDEHVQDQLRQFYWNLFQIERTNYNSNVRPNGVEYSSELYELHLITLRRLEGRGIRG